MTSHYIPRKKNITNFAITLRRGKKYNTQNTETHRITQIKKSRLLKQFSSARTDIHEKLQDCLRRPIKLRCPLCYS